VAAYGRRARKHLEPVYDAKLRDGSVVTALAQICWNNKEYPRSASFAQEALSAVDLMPEDRAIGLKIRADVHMRDREFGPAVPLLEQLVRLQRWAEDLRLLGTCYLALDQPRRALAAFQQALAIRPTRPDVHDGLAQAYQRLGDAARARDHAEKAQWLQRHGQE
jgi:tetratricopeptide (TPR) repeat protein